MQAELKLISYDQIYHFCVTYITPTLKTN